MSFLDSVLSSLGSTTPSQTSLSRPPAAPASSSVPRKDDRGPSNIVRQASSNDLTSARVGGGTKRKAEDQLPRPPRPDAQSTGKPSSVRPVFSGTAKPPPGVPKSASAPTFKGKTQSPNPVSRNGTLGQPKTAVSRTTPAKSGPTKVAPAKPAAPAKPPPKGSYAALMEAAKAAQGKAPTQLGTIKNQQSAPKERLSKVERKRRLMEAQEKEKTERKTKRFEPSVPSKGKVAVKKADSDAPTYKGTAKPSRTPEPVSYRGTANLPSNRGSNDRRPHGKRRMDEYLGTDEEDEGDYGAEDYDDYYSDSSDDMEAGFDDVNREEDSALKLARREDEEEQRMEMIAKKAKMDRQQKLAALASRTKR